jgi:hypothetical protein
LPVETAPVKNVGRPAGEKERERKRKRKMKMLWEGK